MFFAERIKSIGPNDLVLEIGPGGHPHPRSDVLLEKSFANQELAEAQRGHTNTLETEKELFFYEGGNFPFADKKFDYVICSHVLEHVEDVSSFVKEIVRVGKKGYIEFPTIYYDYIYNFPEHASCLFHRQNVIYWLPKSASGLEEFSKIQQFFYQSMRIGYKSIIGPLQEFVIQGFEWSGSIEVRQVSSLDPLLYELNELTYNEPSVPDRPWIRSAAGAVYRKLRSLINH